MLAVLDKGLFGSRMEGVGRKYKELLFSIVVDVDVDVVEKVLVGEKLRFYAFSYKLHLRSAA